MPLVVNVCGSLWVRRHLSRAWVLFSQPPAGEIGSPPFPLPPMSPHLACPPRRRKVPLQRPRSRLLPNCS